MDLMTLAAKIVLDDSSYTKGIKNAEQMGQKLAGNLSAMTVAVGNIAADMIKKAVSSIGNVVGSAVDGYANYQQLIGGVETLFKSSADKVSRYAKQSYKTTGLSANDYMETVTSFSASLLQGLKGDTEKAADLANTAVTDMADNANKMGTDIGAIQTAYQGFAKQNYTMLDNLKLGYGGTQQEMVRLINDSGILEGEIKDLDGITFDQIVEAIHKIQQQMGITGTTAKEASDTISGSKASMKAAWTDFLTLVASDADQKKLEESKKNFEAAFTTYVDNLAPVLETAVGNAPSIISAVVNGITSVPSKAISKLAEGGLGALTATFNGGVKLANWFIEGLVQMFKDINADPSQIAELGNAVGTFIGSALSDIVTNAPTIISGLFTAGVTLAGSLVEGLFSGLLGPEGLPEQMKDIDDEMNDAITEAYQKSAKATGIIEYIKKLGEQYGEAATQTKEFKEAKEELDKLVDVPQWMVTEKTSLENLIRLYSSYTHEQEKQAIETAKRRALQSKQEAVIEAQGKLWEAQAGVEMNRSIHDTAAENLLEFFGLKGAVNRETGEAIDQTFDYHGRSNEQILNEQILSRLAEVTGGSGNQAYEDVMAKLNDPQQKAQVLAWIDNMRKSGTEMETLEASVADLETQLVEATTTYELASSALDKVTSAANSAASALSAGLNSGQYYNWYYGGQGKATGMENVPYNGFRASLHKGEMILTKSEADSFRNGGGNAAVVGAIQELRQDMQNLKIVVGRKTFGRAVVDYGGARTREYLNDYEDRMYSGYGT